LHHRKLHFEVKNKVGGWTASRAVFVLCFKANWEWECCYDPCEARLQVDVTISLLKDN